MNIITLYPTSNGATFFCRPWAEAMMGLPMLQSIGSSIWTVVRSLAGVYATWEISFPCLKPEFHDIRAKANTNIVMDCSIRLINMAKIRGLGRQRQNTFRAWVWQVYIVIMCWSSDWITPLLWARVESSWSEPDHRTPAAKIVQSQRIHGTPSCDSCPCCDKLATT